MSGSMLKDLGISTGGIEEPELILTKFDFWEDGSDVLLLCVAGPVPLGRRPVISLLGAVLIPLRKLAASLYFSHTFRCSASCECYSELMHGYGFVRDGTYGKRDIENICVGISPMVGEVTSKGYGVAVIGTG